MIAAIRLELNEDSSAEIYPAGAFSRINWTAEESCALGEEYRIYRYKNDADRIPGMIIARGLDDNWILRFRETKRYVVRIHDSHTAEPDLPIFQNEGNKFLKCDRDRDSVTFQFVNYLGRSRMRFPEYGNKQLVFEVIPEKMNYENDYISLTEALAEECAALLLEYSGSTSGVFRQSDQENETPLEQFVFLRQFCYGDNISALFEAIKRNPDRLLDEEEELKPFGTGKPSAKFYRNPFSYSRGWQRITGSQNGQDICVPQLVAMTRKYDQLDTPANRFIKFALNRFDSVCTELIGILEGSEGKQAECVREAKNLHSVLENILTDSFFDGIGDLDIMPQNNQVLQKREGYSQIFAACSMIDLALQLDWKGKDDIYEGESRNVALLYEYWLFFELYKVIKSIEGCSLVLPQEKPFITVKDGITVSLKEGEKAAQYFVLNNYGVKVNLYYNRTFSPTDFRTTRYEGSYSRPFRPDYTIAVFPSYYTGKLNGENDAIEDGTVSYIHFDAKYRITDLSSFIGKSDDPADQEEKITEEKADSVINTYKRGDLLKMHTYNDAIRRTEGSYILYPGTSGNKEFCLYDEILPGVGAFSMRPSIRESGENTLQTFIISVIKSQNEKASRLNRMNYYSEMVLSEPSRHKSHSINVRQETLKQGDRYVLGFIRGGEYAVLKKNGLLEKDGEFYFYFYAIEGEYVYPHHKDFFKIPFYRFYRNNPNINRRYILKPLLCKAVSNELVSRKRLTELLAETGYVTEEESHKADYYFIIKVKVIDTEYGNEELKIDYVNEQYGNDASTPMNPKVVDY